MDTLTGSDIIRFDWARPNNIKLDWARLDIIRLDWNRLDIIILDWGRLDWKAGLGQPGHHQARLGLSGQTVLGQVGHHQDGLEQAGTNQNRLKQAGHNQACLGAGGGQGHEGQFVCLIRRQPLWLVDATFHWEPPSCSSFLHLIRLNWKSKLILDF